MGETPFFLIGMQIAFHCVYCNIRVLKLPLSCFFNKQRVMAILCEYRTGDGFYIRGFVHGAGPCTWQIGVKGLDYLRKRGVSVDRDRISLQELEILRNQGLIWTAGSGTTPAPTSTLPAKTADLISDLRKWSVTGAFKELHSVLCGRHGDQRDACFSAEFLNWLRRLDSASDLLQFDEISATDFDDLARPMMVRLTGDLHRGLIACDSWFVLWRLSHLVGIVARQQKGGSICPTIWQTDPILQRLFALLLQTSAQGTPEEQEGRGKRSDRLLSPSIVWDVDGQNASVLFPRQRLPDGIREISWQISTDSGAIDAPVIPQVQFENNEFWIDESQSAAIPSARSYKIEAKIPSTATASERTEQWQFHLSEDGLQYGLFTTAGTLLDSENDQLLASGDYLALIPTDQIATFFGREGVRQVERIPVTPVGWRGWQGWKIHLDPGAKCEPFIVQSVGQDAHWKLEDTPESEVIWRTPFPIWIVRFPRLFIENPEVFADAVLEVSIEESLAPRRSVYLRIGTDIKVLGNGTPGGAYLDLSSLRQLQELYGQLVVRCRPVKSIDTTSLVLRFIRLPELRLGYVVDLGATGHALAVRVESDLSLTEMTAGFGTEMCLELDDKCVSILSASDPVLSPLVVARLPKGAGELQIRIPVSRGALLTSQETVPSWQQLPLRDLDLSSIGLDDRLRIELLEPPLLDRGKILFRLADVTDLKAGTPLHHDRHLNVFEVDLHRLRDAFGVEVEGTIQVRGASRWIEVACLRGRIQNEATSTYLPPSQCQALVDLEAAVASGDSTSVAAIVEKCFDNSLDNGASITDVEIVPISAARAVLGTATQQAELKNAGLALAALATRPDLPEATSLQRMLLLRSQSLLGAGEVWCHDTVQQIKDNVPQCAEKDLLLGECYYRYARNASGPIDGCWRSCESHLDQFLTFTGCRLFRAQYSDAVLLLELVRTMIGRMFNPHRSQYADIELLCPGHVPWIDAVRFLGRTVFTPLGSENIPKVPVLPTTFPTVLSEEDVTLLRIAVSQPHNTGFSRKLLDQLQDWTPEQFYAIGLIRARQAISEGNAELARMEYKRLFQQVKTNGPDQLLDVVLNEMPQLGGNTSSSI